jgi:4-methoxybenzoate monooxygenase (O-demethylating)
MLQPAAAPQEQRLFPELGGSSLPPPGIPALDVDPFSMEFFADPYPVHAQLRDAGPLVWLTRYGIAAVARYEQVHQVLTDWKTFSSARGVGLADFVKHGRFRLPSIVLEVDPPEHSRARAAISKALAPAVMRSLRDSFAREAERLVDELVTRREFDAVRDLAEAYPLRVFPDAVGMRRDGRDNLLPYGDMVFNSFGPPNALFQAAAPRAKLAFPWVETQSLRENLDPNGFGAIVYAQADAGDITHEEAAKLVRSTLTAGVDTTVNGIGAAVYALARFPEQWQKLRANRTLARAAFEEAVRFESPVQTFFRTTTQAAVVGDVPLAADEKILMFLGAANRDPRHWENPDAFDIERRTLGHVGFGAGVHVCVGQLLARLEGELILDAMARKIRTLEISGEPVRRFNNTLRGLAQLPMRVNPA